MNICPSCGATVREGFAICLNCGLNFATGERVAKESPPPPQRFTPPPSTSPPTLLPSVIADAEPAADASDRPKIGLQTRRPASAPSSLRTNQRMVFGICPSCSANDVYAICGNCHHFDRFIGSGSTIECICGAALPGWIICPYCGADIAKGDFSPSNEKQSAVRANLPPDGTVRSHASPSENQFAPSEFRITWKWYVLFAIVFTFLISPKARNWVFSGHSASISVEYAAPYTEDLTGCFSFSNWEKEAWGYSGTMRFRGWKTMGGHPHTIRIEFESRSSSGVILGTGTASFPDLSSGQSGRIELIGNGADDADSIRLTVGGVD